MPNLLVLLAAFIGVVTKEIIYRYTIAVGRRIHSLAIVANAWHHRSDAFSSIAVLIGVIVAYLNPEWQIADSIAAIIVSGFIFKVGFSLTWGGLREVVDTAPDQQVLRQIVNKAFEIDGVENVHDLRARYSGSEIFVELHIIVDPNLSVRKGHDIASTVENRLLHEMPGVTRVIVHVDPEMD
jgi:cation diffusion facilitator family transporter